MKKFNSAILFLLLVSCGKNNSKTAVVAQMQEASPDGIFAVTTTSLNSSAHRSSSLVKITHDGDNLQGKVRLESSEDGIHLQHILTGSRCPTLADDLNRDGFVDVEETLKVSGDILIPLDDDLSRQNPGKDLFPMNEYLYTQNTSFSLLLSDLLSEDEIINDKFVKLASSSRLELSGRPVVIFGVGAGFALPGSVKSFGLWSKQESLPIACGVLQRISAELAEDFETNFRPIPSKEPIEIPSTPVIVQNPEPTPRVGWRQRVRRWYCRIRRLNCTTSLSKEAQYGYIERSWTSEDP